MNRVILIGRLGKNAELKHLTSGSSVAKFSIATEERWRDQQGETKKKTTWHLCVLWGKRAEGLTKYLRKGNRIAVEGSIDNRSWEDDKGQKRYVTEIKVSEVELLGDNGGGRRREEDDDRGGDGGDDWQRGGGDEFGGQTAPEEEAPF